MSLQNFLQSNNDGAFAFGHASLLTRTGGRIGLFDPCWNVDPYKNFIFHPKQYPKRHDCSDLLDKIEFCVVSHEHADHWNGDILFGLRCPVYIMEGRPRLRKRLSEFCNVREIPKQCPAGILSGVKLFFVENPQNTVDSSCIVFGENFSVYVGSDNFLDRKLCTIVESQGPPDIAFIPTQFVHYYPVLMEMEPNRKAQEAARMKHQALDKARMFVDIVKPKMHVPFGGNLLYCEGPDHPLNTILATPEELGGATILNAGDYALKTGGFMSTFKTPVSDTPTWRKLPEMNFEVDLCDRQLVSIIKRVRKAVKTPGHAIVVNNAVTIDAQEGRAYDGVLEGIIRSRKVHRFFFDAPVFSDWASGKITFEEALGSRRFKYSRNPDEFSVNVVEYWANFL